MVGTGHRKFWKVGQQSRNGYLFRYNYERDLSHLDPKTRLEGGASCCILCTHPNRTRHGAPRVQVIVSQIRRITGGSGGDWEGGRAGILRVEHFLQ